MKKILLLFLLLAGIQMAVAQSCEPDPQYADFPAGVYPLPDPEGAPLTLPMGYENQPYELLFTAVVPDTAFISLNGDPDNVTPIDLTNVTLDSITGLPPGLSYDCNPSDCIFPELTEGCVLVSGTPEQAGTYSLVVYTTVPINPIISIQITFPGDLAAGEYNIIIDEDIAIDDPIKDVIGLGQNVPNPFSDVTEIQVDTKQSGTFEFKVYNIIGKLLHEEEVSLSVGQNTITFDGSHLHSGMYFYSVGQGNNDRVTRRMVVHRP